MFFGGLKFVGVTLELYWEQKMFKGSSVKFLSELLPGETLCKFSQIFPPKDLVYTGKKIVTPFN